MSVYLIESAYQTRLGNPTAKGILVFLADTLNGEGYGSPSHRYIANRTETSRATVFRMIQIFESIGLLKRVKSPHDGAFAVQLNVDLLGKDLTVAFRKAHAKAWKHVERCA
jgi:DNA-binding MarR family transcriptional regulator